MCTYKLITLLLNAENIKDKEPKSKITKLKQNCPSTRCPGNTISVSLYFHTSIFFLSVEAIPCMFVIINIVFIKSFFFFFGVTGVWTQGLALARQALYTWATFPALSKSNSKLLLCSMPSLCNHLPLIFRKLRKYYNKKRKKSC
jgi:hypothetical protein